MKTTDDSDQSAVIIRSRSTRLTFTLFIPLTAALLLLLAGHVRAQESNDQLEERELTIDCADIDNPENCVLTGDVIVSERLADLTSAIVEALSDDSSDLCSVTGNTAQCSLTGDDNSPLIVNCTINNNPPDAGVQRSASCSIAGLQDLQSINCDQRSASSGSCMITTRPSKVKEALETLLPGLGQNTVSVGTNLLSSCALGGGTDAFQRDCEAVLNDLASGPAGADQVRKTLDEITPLNLDNTVDNGRRDTNTKVGHAQDRMSRLRAGSAGGGVDVTSLQFFDGQQWVSSGDLLAQNPDSASDAGSAEQDREYSRLGVFLDGSIITSEQDFTGVEEESETDVQALTFGVDYRFTDNLVGGLAFGVGYSETDYGRSRGDLETLSYSLIGYGTYYWENWYFDGALLIGGDEHDQTRVLDCSSGCSSEFVQEAEAEFNGNQIAFTLGSGYDWSIGGFGIGPYVTLSTVDLEVDKYRERMSQDGSGSGYALNIDGQEQDMLTLTAGAQFRYALSFDWGVTVPYFNLAWVNEFENDAQLIGGRFVGNTANDRDFEILTNEIDDEYFIIGGGVVFQFSEGNAGFVEIYTWQENDEVELTGIKAGWRWEL